MIFNLKFNKLNYFQKKMFILYRYVTKLQGVMMNLTIHRHLYSTSYTYLIFKEYNIILQVIVAPARNGTYINILYHRNTEYHLK